MIEEEN